MVLETVCSSKAGTIRSLLIRAWRERWTDLQWGIHIKTVLPRCVTGDLYHLSDCILQQALMGPLPNNLILSYLQHSLCSQIVSYGGVLESISKYDGVHKPHCVQALLNILQNIMKNVTCKGKQEDCLALAVSLVAGVRWLIQVMGLATQQLLDLRTSPEHTMNLNLAGSVLHEILNNPFLTCLLEVGKREEEGMWEDCLKKMNEVETLLSGAESVIRNKELLIILICQLKNQHSTLNLDGSNYLKTGEMPTCHAVHSLVILEALIHPTRNAAGLAQQLLLLHKIKGLSVSQLYLEFLRASFIGLSSSDCQADHELKWAGFLVIKVPAVISLIHGYLRDNMSSPSDDLLVAVKQLASMTHLLDLADMRSNCNCLDLLFYKLVDKMCLLKEDAKMIINRRLQESYVLPKIQSLETPDTSVGKPKLIYAAEPNVSNISSMLSKKDQKTVLSVMRLISGKSLDPLFTAAAMFGRLQDFAKGFVKFNEMSVEPPENEDFQMATDRAHMFDISFLLLSHIVRGYNIDVVLVSENCTSFIENWLKNNFPEAGRVKTPKNMISPDAAEFDDFMKQISSVDEKKFLLCRWNYVSAMLPVVIQEMICQVQCGEMTMTMVTEFIDCLCDRLCCLPICVTAFLCSYIQSVEGDQANYSMTILQYLQTGLTARDGSTSAHGNARVAFLIMLMGEIINYMVQVTKGGYCLSSFSTFLGRADKDTYPLDEHYVAVENKCAIQQPLSHFLEEIWKSLSVKSNLLSDKVIMACQELLQLGGHRWFVNTLVKLQCDSFVGHNIYFFPALLWHTDGLTILQVYSVNYRPYLSHPSFNSDSHIVDSPGKWLVAKSQLALENVYEKELNRSIDFLAGLFHLDVIGCALSFLVHTLPRYLNGPLTDTLLRETRTTALAELTVVTIVYAWNYCSNAVIQNEHSKQSAFYNRELEDVREKLLLGVKDLPMDISTLEIGADGHCLVVAVNNMFRLLNYISMGSIVSPVTYTIVFILHKLVSSPDINFLLTLIPQTLLPNIIPLLSASQRFTYPELLALTAPLTKKQWQSPGAHKAAAKLLCIQRKLELAADS